MSTLPSKKPLLLAYCSICLFETRSTSTVRVAKPARGNFVGPNQSYTFQELLLRYLVSLVMKRKKINVGKKTARDEAMRREAAYDVTKGAKGAGGAASSVAKKQPR